MRIALIAWRNNPVDIFKSLSLQLSKRISGLELEMRFVPFLEDFPIVANECAEECDFIFTFALVEAGESISFIKEKLINVELKTGTRILKALDEDTISGLDESEYLDAKEEMIKSYADLIVNILFNETAFAPEEKDFGL